MSKELEELKLWQREIKETEIEELTHSDKEIGDLIIIILENLEKAVFTNVSKHEGIDHELRVIPQGELNVCEQCEECFVSTLTSTFDKPRYACKAHGKLFEELLGDTTLTISNFGCNKFVSKHSEPQTV